MPKRPPFSWKDGRFLCLHIGALDAADIASDIQHVAHGKLRYATALPLLLGIQTVAKMRKATWDQIMSGVKISRLDVASILAQAAIACRSGEAMEKLYRKLAA